jgi:dihydropyrimidine dehydrogenase (NAD+) subunit PreT
MAEGADIASGRLRSEEYARNFADLVPPLDHDGALVEADRCYFCYDAPCIEACPTGIDIPSFIRKIATGNLKGSALDILSANIMGGVCARVCPTEVLCEGACVRNAQEARPVKIGQLQRHATDWLFDQGIQPFARAAPTGKRVAVVGAGPAGLSCAHGCARAGHEVVVFEARQKPGGLNEHGIAAYKVVDDFAQKEVAFITAIGGIEIRPGQILGRDVRMADLRNDFDAVFLGIGLGGVHDLGQEPLAGVESAVHWIERLRQVEDLATLPVGRNVVVIGGGGSTAIDAAVQSRRLGAEHVTMVYRRGLTQMGATAHEQELAQVNGVKIIPWARPAKLIGSGGHVRAVELEYTRLDDRGELIGTGDGFTLAADMLFTAIGQRLVPGADGSAGLLTIDRGKIVVDAERQTSLPDVWAGGDAVDGLDLTVVAVEDGKIAARAINRRLAG